MRKIYLILLLFSIMLIPMRIYAQNSLPEEKTNIEENIVLENTQTQNDDLQEAMQTDNKSDMQLLQNNQEDDFKNKYGFTFSDVATKREEDPTKTISETMNELSLLNGGEEIFSQSKLFNTVANNMNSQLDVGLLNYNYENASSLMSSDFSNTDFSKNSLNCQDFFKETYGDVMEEKKLEKATLPKGFTASAITASAKKKINSEYSKATSKSIFKQAKSKTSSNSIFKQAAAGPTSYSLGDYSSLQSLYKNAAKENDSAARGEYEDKKTDINKYTNYYKPLLQEAKKPKNDGDQGSSIQNPDVPDNDLPNDGKVYKIDKETGYYKLYIDGKWDGKYYVYDYHNNYGRYKEEKNPKKKKSFWEGLFSD